MWRRPSSFVTRSVGFGVGGEQRDGISALLFAARRASQCRIACVPGFFAQGRREYGKVIYVDSEKEVKLEHHTIQVRLDLENYRPTTDWTTFEYPPKIKQIAAQINSLNAIESRMLEKYLQQQLGFTDAELGSGPVMVAAAPGVAAPAPQEAAAPAAQAAPPPVSEKTHFKLVLTAVNDDAKVKVLKEVRALKPGMKLLESKELVEKLPSILKEEVPKDEAESWVKKIKEAGGTVELK